ncbi:MAG: hypothetical protein FWC00_04765 [Firmicutes bacterium]|nr:hypothetical protein [Bacillota bacterium]
MTEAERLEHKSKAVEVDTKYKFPKVMRLPDGTIQEYWDYYTLKVRKAADLICGKCKQPHVAKVGLSVPIEPDPNDPEIATYMKTPDEVFGIHQFFVEGKNNDVTFADYDGDDFDEVEEKLIRIGLETGALPMPSLD